MAFILTRDSDNVIMSVNNVSLGGRVPANHTEVEKDFPKDLNWLGHEITLIGDVFTDSRKRIESTGETSFNADVLAQIQAATTLDQLKTALVLIFKSVKTR